MKKSKTDLLSPEDAEEQLADIASVGGWGAPVGGGGTSGRGAPVGGGTSGGGTHGWEMDGDPVGGGGGKSGGGGTFGEGGAPPGGK